MRQRYRARLLAALLVCAAATACQRSEPPRNGSSASPPAGPAAAPAPPATPTPPGEDRPKIVVLGDSLTAGLGLSPAQAYPALLQQKLDREGYNWEVVNAGVSGDTSAAGLQRLDWALDAPNVRILVLELGANDGLRGLPVGEMKKNLADIIERAQRKQIAVLLTGMEAPPNFGPEYVVSFRQTYRELSTQYHVTLLPFLLDKVAGVPGLNQGDGIHPNIEGAAIVADNVWAVLKPMLPAA